MSSSRIDGKGLFASAPFDSDDLVMRLGGDVLTDLEVQVVIDRGERYDGIVLDEDLNLTIRPTDWPGIYGNHSCDPNTWLTGAIELRAMRPIAVGEEITSDYATYTMNSDWSMRCTCGASECRHVVTGDDWMSTSLQGKYSGHFARPIAARIEARLNRE